MYTFITAHCLARTITSTWKETNISKSLLNTVLTTYRKVYLIVKSAPINSNVIVDLDTLRSKYAGMNITISEMLAFHAGLPLVTTKELPNMKMKYVRYMTGYKAGYKFNIVKAGYKYSIPQESEYLPDLRITRPTYNTDLRELHTHCLTTVNGFVHATDTDGEAHYVLDGAKTMRISNDNRYGFLSFAEIGKLTKTSINIDHIQPAVEGMSLHDKIVFTVDEALVNKPFFLVLGGYLVFPENGVFWRVGENSFYLDLKRLPYLERLMESKEFIDIAHLGITNLSMSGEAMDLREAFSDKVIKNYLTMSQSFFVSVDSDTFIANKYALRTTNIPGQFHSNVEPFVPMFVRNGRMVEYWTTKLDNTYVVSVPDAYYRNYALSYRDKTSERVTNDALLSQNPIYHTGALFLEITSSKL